MKIKKSQQNSLSLWEIVKGFLYTVGAAFLMAIYPIFQGGELPEEWLPIILTSISFGIGYLIVKFKSGDKNDTYKGGR